MRRDGCNMENIKTLGIQNGGMSTSLTVISSVRICGSLQIDGRSG